ncbi:hypothetical protein OM076_22430 [Solirubrobacter ginsenosidimutans]|uniref:Lactonase family protein n=1 Tax=Solirubrobacter ginsenosidimutans TaxID=490573 RepID=A0A9X3MVB6_9ACTN|nr:hypothetical protein [Solirubrobacter ginsenosidimutans]MDA0163047.1 hypothetical protein [Solirubrobacter ginsenosidimutans]
MRVLRVIGGAVVLASLSASVANAAWTRPAVLVTGDDAGLLASVARADGSLRTAIADTGRDISLGLVDAADAAPFADPLVALRSPARVAYVSLAADGSGVALDVQRRAPSTVVGFDAAGTTGPLLTVDDVGGGPALAISPTGTAVVAWVAKSPQGFEVDAAFRDPGSATFGAPVRAGYTADKRTLVSAGIGDSGEAVVAWQTNSFPSDLAAAVRLPGAGFSKAGFVSRNAGDVRLAVGPGGQAILASTRGAGLDVAVKPPGADTVPAAKRIDRGQGFAVDVAAAGPSAVAAVWLAAPKARDRARVRVFEGDSRLRRIGTVGRDGYGETVKVAIDGAGATVVAWEEALKAKRGDPSARSQLGVAYRPAGGRLRAPVHFGPVSLEVTPESVQLGPGGRAWVLYEAFETSDRDAGYRRVYGTERRP